MVKLLNKLLERSIYCIIYNVGGHAGHIGEEVVTKISETHNI